MNKLYESEWKIMIKGMRGGSWLLVFMLLAGLAACGDANLTDIEHVQLAKDYLDKKELQSGMIELKNALSKNADNIEARLLLGNVYLDLGDGAAAGVPVPGACGHPGMFGVCPSIDGR